MRKKLIDLLKKRSKIGLTVGGGGWKTTFALGFCEILTQNGCRFSSLTGTSAGAGMSLGIIIGNVPEIMNNLYEVSSEVKLKFQLEDILKRKPLFPHEKVYRNMLISHIDIKKVHESKVKFSFNALEFPPYLSEPNQNLKRAQVIVSLMNAYVKENKSMKKHNYTPSLLRVIEKHGLREKVFHIDENTSESSLINIVIACSCVPPIVNFPKIADNKYYLDGGFYDNLPVKKHEEELELILAIYYKAVTKERNINTNNFLTDNVFYIYPDRELPVSTMDYLGPDRIKKTYEMGRSAAENLLRFIDFHNKFFFTSPQGV